MAKGVGSGVRARVIAVVLHAVADDFDDQNKLKKAAQLPRSWGVGIVRRV